MIAFLKERNILRVNLDRIAWRMQEKSFFDSVVELLAARHVYNNVLWSYGVKHNDVAAIRQFLQFADGFVSQCGDWLDSPLLTIDPIVRKSYEQMDYRPLVNARVGQLGRNREILNDRFLAQYERLLKILSYRRELKRRRTDDGDLLLAAARPGGGRSRLLRPGRRRPIGHAVAVRLFRRLSRLQQGRTRAGPADRRPAMPTTRSNAGERPLPTSSTRPTTSIGRA